MTYGGTSEAERLRAVHEQRELDTSCEAAEDEADRRLLAEAAERYAGLDWRTIGTPLE